jgi:hypothetical protein
MSQSQSHGFIWENEIREKVFELKNCNNDTNKYDIEAKDNKWDNNENISIKTSKTDCIDCGDIIRFYQYDFTKKNTIILIKYDQKGEYKVIKEILEIDYNLELRNYLFGSVTIDKVMELVNMVKSVKSGKIEPEIHKELYIFKNNLQKDFGMNIRIGIKIDSKNQRRVQCSIPKLSVLLNQFPMNIKSAGMLIRGIAIVPMIYSLVRKRNNKNKEINNN